MNPDSAHRRAAACVARVQSAPVLGPFSRQQIRTGGLKIVTTLDVDAQRAATGSIDRALTGQPKELRPALVAIDPEDGGVRAYYGGDRGRGFYDNAQAARPPASTFKPLVLAAAEERGINYRSFYNGTSPRVFSDRGGAALYNQKNLQCPVCPLDTSMVHSLNMPFYALTEQIGPDRVRDLALRLGIPEKYGNQPTMVDVKGEPSPGRTRADIAIGRYPVTSADLASVYATLAGGGTRMNRHFVVSVSNTTGVVLHKYQAKSVKVLPAGITADVGAVLQQVVAEVGRVPGVPAAAKTGSQQYGDTTDSSDAWTAGWASGLAAVVLIGRDKPGPIRTRNGKTINGDGMPYEIFSSFLSGAFRGRTAAELPPPSIVGSMVKGDLETLEGNVAMAPGRPERARGRGYRLLGLSGGSQNRASLRLPRRQDVHDRQLGEAGTAGRAAVADAG